MGASPETGLVLNGSLERYRAYEDEGKGDHVLSPREVEELPNETLAEILDEALKERANEQTNGHHLLFDGLPDARIASLFAGNLVDTHYLRGLSAHNKLKAMQVIAHLLKVRGARGPELADRFLLGAELSLDWWDGMFAALYSSYPDYVRPRTDFDYRPFVAEGVRLLWDVGQDGIITNQELAAADDDLSVERLNAEMDRLKKIFLEGANTDNYKIATHYAFHGLHPVLQATVLAYLLADYGKGQTQKREELSHFLNIRIFLDVDGFRKSVSFYATWSGLSRFMSILQFLDGLLEPRARALLQQQPFILFAPPPPQEAPTLPPQESGGT